MQRQPKENKMNPNVSNTAALVGRILLALMFITSGFGKVTGFEGTVGYIASKHLPLPQLGAIIAIACELGAGVLLAIGFKARWAGLVLAIFTLAAGILFHDFWNADAASKMAQSINFWKNVSIAGGMLMVFAFGPGRYSVDKG
jgi:putative oxidoreductase